MGFKGECCHRSPAVRELHRPRRQDDDRLCELNRDRNTINSSIRIPQKIPVVERAEEIGTQARDNGESVIINGVYREISTESTSIGRVYSDEGPRGEVYLMVDVYDPSGEEPVNIKLPKDVASTLQ